jgi:hypothetical protein
MEKQTAVDWLIAELFKKGIINADAWVWDESINIKQIIEQAKGMEKEQNSGVTRFEVVDESGRVYSKWNCKIELSYQDDGKTLKVFVRP